MSCGHGDNKQCVHVAETVRMSPAATYNSQSFVRCDRRTRLLFDLVSVFSECLTRWMCIKTSNFQSNLVCDAMSTANYTTH